MSRAIEHLKERFRAERCPYCARAGTWDVGKAVGLVEVSSLLRGYPTVVFPAIPVMHECGYTMFFNAVKIGAMDAEGKEKS